MDYLQNFNNRSYLNFIDNRKPIWSISEAMIGPQEYGCCSKIKVVP